MKTCKICRKKYKPIYSSLQPTCTDAKCVLSWSKKVEEKKGKRELKAMKERQKSISQWRKELQNIFNSYIRLRDKNKSCVSCGTPLSGKYDAGHYYSVGAYPNLRFNEDNVHGQCTRCNQHLHGNLIEYRNGILARIGATRLAELEQQRNKALHLSMDAIKEQINIYKTKIKLLCTT